MYFPVLLNPIHNWTYKLNHEIINWDDRYIYSFYFALTTMLTVGYGDIAPTTKLELVIVMMVQIFGVVVFAYVINEIGSTLS